MSILIAFWFESYWANIVFGICLVLSVVLLLILIAAFMFLRFVLAEIDRKGPPRKVDPIREPRVYPPEPPILPQPSLEELLLGYLETGTYTATQLVALIHRDHLCWYHERRVYRALEECAQDNRVELSGETWRLVR